jgi:tRNA modification GTPase
VRLTPNGRGAISTVLVAGKEAVATVAALFRPANGRPLASLPFGRIVFGLWGEEPGEELVVVCHSAERVEVHCHGGRAAVAAVVDLLVHAGCRETPWQEWIREETHDVIEAAALEALAQARTLRTAVILLDQSRGALRRAVDEIIRDLKCGNSASVQAALARLQSLVGRAALGRHLVEPFQIVLSGKPNVGKSSLVNALLGYRRSIVYDEPGTTRDVVTATTAFDGWPVELSDTAGLRGGGDAVESAGVRLAYEQLARADVRVLVFDSSQPWSADDDALLGEWPDALVVHTKSDLPRDTSRPRPSGVDASGVVPGGADELVRAIGARLAPEPPPPGAAMPFNELQIATIERAYQFVQSSETAAAVSTLESLLFGCQHNQPKAR